MAPDPSALSGAPRKRRGCVCRPRRSLERYLCMASKADDSTDRLNEWDSDSRGEGDLNIPGPQFNTRVDDPANNQTTHPLNHPTKGPFSTV